MATPLPTLRRLRLQLAVGTVGLALGSALLFGRQVGRLTRLAEHGVEAQARVVAISSDGGGTYYAYAVDGITHEWNVKREEARFDVGAAFPITYLPEEPSFSRPGVDRRSFAQRATETRTFGTMLSLGLLVLGTGLVGWVHRQITRAVAGEVEGPPTIEGYRRRLRWTGALLVVPLSGITLFHAREAAQHGESWVPVAGGATLALALVGLLFWAAYRDGPEASQERATRILRWVAPLAAALAGIRLLVLLLAG